MLVKKDNMSQTKKPAPVQNSKKVEPKKCYRIQFRSKEQPRTATAIILNLKLDDLVMVVTDHGPEPARIIEKGPTISDNDELQDLQASCTIQRRCNKEEFGRFERHLIRETEADQVCKKLINSHKLKMKLVRVERYFNGSKIIFFFTADNRVDFRSLVKDLVQEFRTRVEMRQVGVRHETKMLNGLGGCGRELCCASHINNFAPVSIKMAKEQNLPLNPTKISGICNRLLCCLTYEYPVYKQIRKGMPRCGKSITVAGESWKVVKHNVLEENVTVINNNDRSIMRKMEQDEWQAAGSKKKGSKK